MQDLGIRFQIPVFHMSRHFFTISPQGYSMREGHNRTARTMHAVLDSYGVKILVPVRFRHSVPNTGLPHVELCDIENCHPMKETLLALAYSKRKG
ncbi:hypothetical protein AVEN_274414-1 [Araneus ventricosus]|uniref:Uncharacterized protein n=1 Tax=Araneus ventricosus TaxID=182803 RepID=A0A4Y2E4D2_ARAVE|nr:hypothetical protein AVEN_274414-1 [Araneus ventricosus]